MSSEKSILEIRVRVAQDGRPVNLALLERTIANLLPSGMELTDCSIRRISEMAHHHHEYVGGNCIHCTLPTIEKALEA